MEGHVTPANKSVLDELGLDPGYAVNAKLAIRIQKSIVEGGGNVFADLGLPNAEEHLLKAGLVTKLADVIRARDLNQTAAAKLTGISQPDLSKILRGRFRDVSADRLIRALTRLDSVVEITVRRHGRQVGEPIRLRA